MRPALIALPALLLAAACDGGGDPVQQALRDASAARHAAATPTTVELEQAAVTRAQTAAGSPEQALVDRMIAGQEAALAGAEIVLRDSRDADVRRMAEANVTARKRELAELRAWSVNRAPSD